MITIDVGTEHEKYSVYAELIAYYSEYFKGTLNGPWKEAEDRVIELPDIDPRVFDIFIDWLYTQKLPKKTRDWIAPTPGLEAGSHGQGRLAERLMMKSYVFADRFLVPQFRVAIYKYYANFCNSGGNPPYYDAIIYAFDNLPPTSAILTLLVRTHCAYWNENSDTTDNGELEARQDLPQEFFFRVMAVASKMRDRSKAKGIACCDCHNETATTEREGCDECMPLPEVKEESNTVEGEAQADSTQADANDQANTAATANNNDQTDQDAVQADQPGGNHQADLDDGQANQTDGNHEANQLADQASQGVQGEPNVSGGEQLNIGSQAEAANNSGEMSVPEEGATPSSNRDVVPAYTEGNLFSGVDAVMNAEAR
jgi:hypothetical protein